MAINVISFGATPQAGDDLFLAGTTGLTENSTDIVWLAVMANDLGGQAKSLYSLDDGSSTGTTPDLLAQDLARTEALSTDTSLAGARIWITADGKVGYDAGTLGAAFQQQLQQLNPGEVLTDSFTYAIRLGNGTLSWATATVQFAGLNDAPVVTGAVLGNTVEDGASLTLDALANASDVDHGSVLHVVDLPDTLPAGVQYDATTHSFTLDPGHAAYQHLAAGQVLPVTVLYGVSDGAVTTPASVTFTLTGSNDAAQIGAPTATQVTEDVAVDGSGLLSVAGTIAVSDLDDGEAAFQAATTGNAGNLGSLTLGADGGYVYRVANADVQFLGSGDTHTDTFTVTSIDGTTKQVSFTTTGVNDAAVIGEPTNAAVTEDLDPVAGALGASGTISISDADQGQASFQTTVAGQAGNLGGLTLAANGGYTYSVADADVQFLGAGDTHTDVFTVTALDGTTKQVSFTATGVNDAAVIGEPTNASVTEDANVASGNLAAAGTLSITDADQGQAGFQTTVNGQAGNLGSLALAANGAYTYTVANADVQSLGATDSHVDTFTVASLDGTTRQVSFTVNGANDAAVITGTSTGSVQEDTGVAGVQLTTGGTLAAADADAGQSLFQAQPAAAGTWGTFTLSADGAWTYAVSNSLAAVQALNTGQSLSDSFTAISQDGSASQLVTVTIQGLNDVNALTGTSADNTFGFPAVATAAASTISDPGGNDTVSITGNGAVLSTLNFERVGSDLQIQVNNQAITVLDHYGASANAMEQITFAPGQTFAGYALAGTYKIDAGADSVAGNGNSNDVVAGTSVGNNPVDGGAGVSGNDLLFGNAGNDVLNGNRGNDLLVGGAGSDTFVFNSALDAANNVDRIADFQANATDTVLLSKGTFGALATAGSAGGTALLASEFQASAGAATAAVGAGVHVLFDTSTGNLYYDADGGGAAGRTLFATLDLPGLTGTVDATDFKVGL